MPRQKHQSDFKKSCVKGMIILTCLMLISSGLAGCGKNTKKVVVYTSVDQIYAEKIFKAFEKATGIKVDAAYDAEAQKTVGIVNRLIGEKSSPQADVFWNSEILQTILLKESGMLEKVTIENSKDLPASFIDKDGEWFAFGGRARVLIFNKTLISKENCPKTMEDFAKSVYTSKAGLSSPIFGTASTQAAVLYSYWGPAKAKMYYQDLKKNGISILDGNGVVKDYVSQKELVMGMTDTDDALSEMAKNKDLDIVFMDQGDGQMGTLVIPNTVSKIKNGPDPEQADLFMNYLLSAATEQLLVTDQWIQIPVHDSVKAPDAIGSAKIKIMAADFNTSYQSLEQSKTDLTGIFIR